MHKLLNALDIGKGKVWGRAKAKLDQTPCLNPGPCLFFCPEHCRVRAWLELRHGTGQGQAWSGHPLPFPSSNVLPSSWLLIRLVYYNPTHIAVWSMNSATILTVANLAHQIRAGFHIFIPQPYIWEFDHTLFSLNKYGRRYYMLAWGLRGKQAA